MNKEYRIVAWETVGGVFTIYADSEKEAEELAIKRLDEEGSEIFYETTHRETCVIEVEES